MQQPTSNGSEGNSAMNRKEQLTGAEALAAAMIEAGAATKEAAAAAAATEECSRSRGNIGEHDRNCNFGIYPTALDCAITTIIRT